MRGLRRYLRVFLFVSLNIYISLLKWRQLIIRSWSWDLLAIKLLPWHTDDVLGMLDPEYEGAIVVRKVISCLPVKVT
jgi:hypothetical protein